MTTSLRADPGYQLSLRLHNELEALYPRIEQHAAFFRSHLPVDPRLPRPPAKTPGARLDPLVCAPSVKAATTKRAILALCELEDGDSAFALARVLLEDACLLEWLIRGEGRQCLESYAMFTSVVRERAIPTLNELDKQFGGDRDSGVRLSSEEYHRAIWKYTFSNTKGTPTTSDRPTWTLDTDSGNWGPVSVRKMFSEVVGDNASIEYDVLYGALGSDIIHSGPFSLSRTLKQILPRGIFTLRDMPDLTLCTIALATSNTAMHLVIDSLTEYIGLDLSAELASMKAQARVNPYEPAGRD